MDAGLAQRMIKARSAHGWSQADLAKVSGIAAPQISRYELGKNVPRPPVIAKLASSLAVSFEWLAYGEGDPECGLQAPAQPSSQKLLGEMELTDEEHELLSRLAKASGLTNEMMLKKALQLGLNEIKQEALSGTKSTP